MADPRDIVVRPPGAAGGAGRNLIAVIGVDRYQKWPRLRNAVCDARGALTLFQQLGFEHAAAPLLDECATGAAMRALVTHQLRGLGPDDNLVLFYAGHGATQLHRLGDDVIKTGYLVPVDAEDEVFTWIDLEGWLRAVALLPAKHILVILDACHSGIALDPIIKWRDKSSWRDEPLATLKARRSRRIITSALDDQTALDSGPVHGHSLFTGCLIEGLRYELRRRRSPVTTGSELGLYLQQRVESYPHSRQTPDFGTFAFDDRGEMVISLAIEPHDNEAAIVELAEHGDTIPQVTPPFVWAGRADPGNTDRSNPVATSARYSEMIERLRKASLQLLLLIVMPVFGVGALLFFAHGECNATSKVLDAPPSGSVGAKPEPEPVTIMLPPPPQDSAHSVTEVSGREATTAPESTTFDNETADDKNRKRPATRGATTLQRPVTSPIAAVVGDKDMKATAALVHHATSLETARRWTEARAAYQQLEKAKGYSLGEALYHEAWCAYQSNAFEDAVHLAAESASMAGPFRMRAMMLYGDGLYRRGEYARAKNILLGLLKSLPVEERARAAKEIAACNDKLGLEPADGIRD